MAPSVVPRRAATRAMRTGSDMRALRALWREREQDTLLIRGGTSARKRCGVAFQATGLSLRSDMRDWLVLLPLPAGASKGRSATPRD